jgi:hypothetical protein
MRLLFLVEIKIINTLEANKYWTPPGFSRHIDKRDGLAILFCFASISQLKVRRYYT